MQQAETLRPERGWKRKKKSPVAPKTGLGFFAAIRNVGGERGDGGADGTAGRTLG